MYPWIGTKLCQEATRNIYTTLNSTKIIINSMQMGSKSQIHQEKNIHRQVICCCCTQIMEPATSTIKREITSNDIFKKQLKTYLFHKAFNQSE